MDAIELLTKDHRQVETLFAEYEAAPSPVEQHEVIDRVIRELSVHAAVEEQLLYPVLRFGVPNGGKLADEAIEEHQQVKELLADLERFDTTDERWFQRAGELMSGVRHHVEEEEGTIFPKLRDACDQRRLDVMGELMDKAKSLVPTHPHPRIPGTATAQLLAGPWASIADRLRDFVEDMRKAG